jgi:hypothetical protein
MVQLIIIIIYMKYYLLFFVGTIDELKQLYFILETKSLNQLKYKTFDESILEKNGMKK